MEKKKFVFGSSKTEVLSLIPERKIKRMALGNVEVGVLRIAEEFHVFDCYCPHRGASLIQGSINALGELICPLHEYRFDLKTGQVKSGSCADLKVYPSKLTEVGLEISLY